MRRTFVLPVADPATRVRIDFIFSTTPYEQQAIARAVPVDVAGVSVGYATAEDLILHKLFAGRARDLEDITGVGRAGGRGREAGGRAPDQARFRVTAVEVTGDTLWTREYPYAPLPVPAAEADSVRSGILEGRLDFASRMGASRSDLERQVRERLYLPAFRPPLAAVRISADGSVWLQWTAAPGETGTRWLGLDPDGDPVARLELPRNVSLREVDGANAWAVETDELGVPYVLRLRLGPSDPSQ